VLGVGQWHLEHLWLCALDWVRAVGWLHALGQWGLGLKGGLRGLCGAELYYVCFETGCVCVERRLFARGVERHYVC
jgi:hypothetical protein